MLVKWALLTVNVNKKAHAKTIYQTEGLLYS
jgi:hypothetical protein